MLGEAHVIGGSLPSEAQESSSFEALMVNVGGLGQA